LRDGPSISQVAIQTRGSCEPRATSILGKDGNVAVTVFLSFAGSYFDSDDSRILHIPERTGAAGYEFSRLVSSDFVV
jgi:hypothetical protein